MWEEIFKKGNSLPGITSEEINQKIDPVLRAMEKEGITLDVAVLEKLSDKIDKNVGKLETKIYKLAGEEFNINSPSQLAQILFVKLKLPTTDLRKTKGGISTAASELKKIEKKHKIIAPLLEYRELSKLLSTYLKPLPTLIDDNSRLHTTYGQDTTTGRINSCEPNLQNIPIKGRFGAEIRKAFTASPGMVLVAADYSQIELRIVACLSGDEKMIEAFRQNKDIHARTAAEIFNTKPDKVTADQRRVAKTVNFGVLYGMSPYGLSQTLGIEQEKAAEFIKKYFEAHKGIKDYCNKMLDHAAEHGYVETLFGYKRYLPNINSPYRNVSEAEGRMAINTPVQGSAAEILKLAMIELESRIKNLESGNRPRILLTVHDEIVLEVPDKSAKGATKLVKDVMENVVKICVPIEASVKIGQNWGEMSVV